MKDLIKRVKMNVNFFILDFRYKFLDKVIPISNFIFKYVKIFLTILKGHIWNNSVTYCFIFIAICCLLIIGNQNFLNDYIHPFNNFNLSKVHDQRIILDYYVAKQTHGIKLLTVFAGFVGLLLAFWRSFNLDETRKNDTRKEINERFTKAVELLGSNNEAVRIGALYTLEHISKENKTYTNTCMDIISSYFRNEMKSERVTLIRNNWDEQFKIWDQIDKKENISDYLLNTELDWNYRTQPKWELPEDLKTAFKIITQRSEKEVINFKQIDFTGVDFTNTASFFNYLDFTNTCFRYARFAEKVKFKKCILNYCDFGRAYLPAANFTNQDLESTRFTKALLQDGIFKNADLTLTNFKGTDLQSTDFAKAKFYFTNLYNADYEKDLFSSHKFVSAFIHSSDYRKNKKEQAKFKFYTLKREFKALKLLIKDLSEEELLKCGLFEKEDPADATI